MKVDLVTIEENWDECWSGSGSLRRRKIEIEIEIEIEMKDEKMNR